MVFKNFSRLSLTWQFFMEKIFWRCNLWTALDLFMKSPSGQITKKLNINFLFQLKLKEHITHRTLTLKDNPKDVVWTVIVRYVHLFTCLFNLL